MRDRTDEIDHEENCGDDASVFQRIHRLHLAGDLTVQKEPEDRQKDQNDAENPPSLFLLFRSFQQIRMVDSVRIARRRDAEARVIIVWHFCAPLYDYRFIICHFTGFSRVICIPASYWIILDISLQYVIIQEVSTKASLCTIGERC